MEPLIYRDEVLTISGVLGDIRLDVGQLLGCSEKTMAKKRKKRTPEEIAQQREWHIQSDANLRRLRELVDRGWAELRARERGEGATGS
jgi:hypothetical protein